jgi:hypothetical protein
LTRSFRIYGKKRGHRRTGSRLLGSLGEAVFFAVFFLLGCGGLVLIFATVVIPEWRVNHSFVEQTCTVRKHLAKNGDPEISIVYDVAGKLYESLPVTTYRTSDGSAADEMEKQEILDSFEIGRSYACWYDPQDPGTVVLARGYRWWLWLMLVVPVLFLLIGGGGLAYAVISWGVSAERRAALAKRAGHLDAFTGNGHAEEAFPHVPSESNFVNSPGTTLSYRLPVASSPAWSLFIWLAACLLWNGLVSVFAAIAVSGHVEHRPDWLLTILVIPFAVIGLGMLVFFVRQLWVATAIGPTLIEISQMPLHPGGRYELFLSQSGRLKMKSLEILLVCDEEATYRHGTDTRIETRRVCEESVFRREEFEIGGVAFETRFAVEVPVTGMHSFKSDHNEVNWRVVVRGQPAGWPEYQRVFPVLVHPAAVGSTS